MRRKRICLSKDALLFPAQTVTKNGMKITLGCFYTLWDKLLVVQQRVRKKIMEKLSEFSRVVNHVRGTKRMDL